ncbi:hypothetical protein MMC13_006308 [Lambiella insularis]|nr:hypothetical protein [Lambiella insularis]
MGKRTTFDDEKLAGTPRKKQKLDDGPVEAEPRDLDSSHALRQLLKFQQDARSVLYHNIQAFKVFLDSILYEDEGPIRKQRLSILLDYLSSAAPEEGDRSSIPLADVIQTWSFAAQSNHDGLLSAVPAVLTLLLKTISGSIDFQEVGSKLCNTLLHKEQIRLFDRGLTANKSKDRLISPCLRLLTEIAAFDGGSSARKLYAQRDVTFKRLDIFLSMRSSSVTANAVKVRPSVRNNALRYVLANLKFQDQIAKGDILSQSKVVRGIFQDISEDPPEVVVETLESLKASVILDKSLARKYKSRLLTDWSLAQISRLYDHLDKSAPEAGRKSVVASAHDFLHYVCTTIDHGVLVEQNGWYDPGARETKDGPDVDVFLLDYEQIEAPARYKEKVSVRNTTLATFLQYLRPYANEYHKSLILATFAAAPELVADYFFKKKTFSFEPKLSATWIGYSAFLFSCVQLPIPELQRDMPPSLSVVLESLIPQPLNPKTLTKCINQKLELITFFATRLLIVAFEKLGGVLSLWSTRQDSRWKMASSRLVSKFSQRCPELKCIVIAVRNVPTNHALLREALLRLIGLYYKVTPQLALNEKFDVSAMLTSAFDQEFLGAATDHEYDLQSLQLDHLLAIARSSPDMNWWHTSAKESNRLSPFTTTLRLYVSRAGTGVETIQSLLKSLVAEHTILQQVTRGSSLNALTASLADLDGWRASEVLYLFLDNCILRFVRKPVKYCGELDTIAEPLFLSSPDTKNTVSLLFTVLLEQWPFFIMSSTREDLVNVTEWLARYLRYSVYIGEDVTILSIVKDNLSELVDKERCESKLEMDLVNAAHGHLPSGVRIFLDASEPIEVLAGDHENRHIQHQSKSKAEPTLSRLEPPEEADDHPELSRWTRKDLLDAVEDGAVGELLLCLCSKYGEIRKQAFDAVRALSTKVIGSDYTERQQLHLLLEEIKESAKGAVLNGPLPYFTGVLASRIVTVMNDPLHFMYTKVNKFLNRSPVWDFAKLPSYWVDRAFLHPPADIDTHHQEVKWVLETLLDGLRTREDMESYRKCNVFERTLSLSASPCLPPDCFENIIDLFYRCTYVDGGTTLITRCGLMSWIQAQLAHESDRSETLKALASQVYEACDIDRVTEWSDGTLAKTIGIMTL